jgi:hypothetical protein
MLFILRQLRRSFFQPGKLRTYLAYAFGEIVLIVFGILIAVQIGDWKEERKIERQRVELIDDLKEDFRTSLKRLETSISKAKEINDNLLAFLNVAAGENNHLSLAELKSLASYGMEGIWFQPAQGAYKSALSTGDIGLLEDSVLNEFFIDFEADYLDFQGLHEVSRRGMFEGENMAMRRMLGSIHTLYETTYHTPEVFRLSDEEYRHVIAQKEVYSAFENRQWVSRSTLSRLEQLKSTAEDILNRLEDI